MKFNRTFLIFFVIVILAALSSLWWFEVPLGPSGNSGQAVLINDFEECQSAGYTVSDQTPRSCTTPQGLTFYEETTGEEVCIQVITTATNPQTGESRDFPTPCDVPLGWSIVTPDSTICAQVITTAINTQTGEERDFPTPCDVPDGWTVKPTEN